MNIIVVGSKAQADLIKAKVKGEHTILFAGFISESHLEKANVVFDFTPDDHQEALEQYADYPKVAVFLNSVTTSLAEQVVYQSELGCKLFGFKAPFFFK